MESHVFDVIEKKRAEYRIIESLHEAMKIFLIHSKIKYDEIDEEEKQKNPRISD
jgi:hypothetical protein